MQTNGSNGAGHADAAHAPIVEERIVTPPPDRVRDLAEACERFVERALGVRPDYEPETLPLVDHWIAEARKAAGSKPETAAVVAHAAGAYFGEVVRRRHASWWRAEGDDPGSYRIELASVYLSFSPVQLVADALFYRERPERPEKEEGDEHSKEEPAEEEVNQAPEQLELDDADREDVMARLAELPPVPEGEFYALATRLEVIDIAVDAIRSRRLGEGEGDATLGPDDYES